MIDGFFRWMAGGSFLRVIAGVLILMVLLSVPFFLFFYWSNQVGEARAYSVTVNILEIERETTTSTFTTLISAGNNIMVPVTNSSTSTTYYAVTPETWWPLDMRRFPPLGVQCARIEPRPGQGHYLTEVTPGSCPR